MEQNHYNQLDVFRGLAALSVCAVHFNYNSNFFHNYFAMGIFVQLFFSLSGFVIFLNYHNSLNKFKDLTKFVKKRFKRLYPLHFFFLIIFALLECLKYFLSLKYGISGDDKIFEVNNIKNFLLNIFFLQHFAESANFNIPAWSISVEIMLYITFALLVLYLKRFIVLISIIYSLFFIYFFSNLYGASNTINAYYSGLYSFFIGCLFCYLFIKNKIFIKSFFYEIFYLIIITLFIGEIFYFKLLVEYNYFYSIFFGLIFFLSCYLNKNSIIYKFLFNSFFIFLGKISYSIYLSHLLVITFLSRFLRFVLKYPYTDGSLQLTLFEANLYTLLAYFITIIFSSFSYKYVEMKFYKKN